MTRWESDRRLATLPRGPRSDPGSGHPTGQSVPPRRHAPGCRGARRRSGSPSRLHARARSRPSPGRAPPRSAATPPRAAICGTSNAPGRLGSSLRAGSNPRRVTFRCPSGDPACDAKIGPRLFCEYRPLRNRSAISSSRRSAGSAIDLSPALVFVAAYSYELPSTAAAPCRYPSALSKSAHVSPRAHLALPQPEAPPSAGAPASSRTSRCHASRAPAHARKQRRDVHAP